MLIIYLKVECLLDGIDSSPSRLIFYVACVVGSPSDQNKVGRKKVRLGFDSLSYLSWQFRDYSSYFLPVLFSSSSLESGG